MINFVTNREYSGKNVDILMASGKGSEFAGFHQGKKFFGVTGNQLKGMKAAAVVQFVVEKKDSEGKESKPIILETPMVYLILIQLLSLISKDTKIYPGKSGEKEFLNFDLVRIVLSNNG